MSTFIKPDCLHILKILTITLAHWVGALWSAFLMSYAWKMIKLFLISWEEQTTILVNEMQTDLIFELGYLVYLLTVLPSVKIFRPAIVSTELNREEKSQTIYLPLGARERIHSLWGARKTWWGSRSTFNPPLLWNSFDCNWRDRYQSTAGMQEMNLTTFWRLCNMMP